MKSKLSQFFLFCAGADENILKRTPTDINKYAGIGATVFFTGVLAFVASAYAIFTIFNSYIMAIFFGVIWGLMIFNLDRYIVSSMKKRGSFFGDMGTALPRIILAILIAVVIAKPLELKIFDSEIQSELVMMEQEKFKMQEDRVGNRFDPKIDSLKSEILVLKNEITEKQTNRDLLSNIAIAEADGTGGSLQRNLGPIYMAKKAEADRAQEELNATLTNNELLISDKEANIASFETKKYDEISSLNRTELNGFAARMDALGRLGQRSQTIFWASLFITLLFIAIETAPVFVKLISSRSPYDYVLNKHEHRFKMNHKEITSLVTNAVENRIKFETETTQYKTQLVSKAEKQITEHLIKEEIEQLKKQPLVWKDLLRRGRLFGLDS